MSDLFLRVSSESSVNQFVNDLLVVSQLNLESNKMVYKCEFKLIQISLSWYI